MKTRDRGFTLIELMITVAILAIIAAVALPSYRSYVIRAQRSEGQVALTSLSAQLERYYSNNNTYTTNFSTLNATSVSESGNYTLSIAAGTTSSITTSFALTADPNHSDDPDCDPMTLNSAGQKGPAGCWQ